MWWYLILYNLDDDTYDVEDIQVAGKITIYSVDETDDSWEITGEKQFASLGSGVAIVSINLDGEMDPRYYTSRKTFNQQM